MHPAFWRHNGQWRAERIAHLSREAKAWARRGVAELDAAQGYRAGNQLVAAVSTALRAVVTAYDEDEIDSLARARARHCSRVSVAEACAYAEARGLRLPAGPNVTNDGLHARLGDQGWWRRRLRAIYGREAEGAFRDLGRVHRHEDPYITDDGLRRYLQQRDRAQRFLESHDVACKETGELFALSDIAARSLACESIRRGELMTRLRGFEEYANSVGYTWAFFTLTAPSAYHPRLVAGGAANPKYNGSTVRQTRDLLQRLWTRVRAKVKRLSLMVYGFRIAEPHHDATPHWHMIMFGSVADLAALWEIIADYWYSVNCDELVNDAALEARAQRKLPDPSKGDSPAGYLIKYIAKGIDGYQLDSDDPDETDLPGMEASLRVVAWARLHGIRQFQQIGGPPIGLWRELRRLREPVAEPKLEAARLATDAKDFAAFWRASPGIVLDKELPRDLDANGRRVVKLTAWREIPTERVIGVRCVGAHGRIVRECTRPYSWVRIRRAPGARSDLGPVAITIRSKHPANMASTIAADVRLTTYWGMHGGRGPPWPLDTCSSHPESAKRLVWLDH